MVTRWIVFPFAITLSTLFLSGCGTMLRVLEPKEEVACYSTFPTFRWEGLPEASSYQIQVATDEKFEKIVLDRSGIVQDTFRTPQELPLFNTKLYWRARPLVKGKLKGWSDPLSFSIKPLKPPESRQPSGEIKELQPVFQWDKVAEADGYHLQLSTNKEFSTVLWEQPNCGETKSQLIPLRLKYDTPHFWRVRAVAKDGGVSPWSGVQQFLIPFSSPQAKEPSGSLASLALSFTWTRSPIALSHEIQVSRDPAFGQLEIDELVEGAGYDPPAHKLKYNVTYHWRVSGHNKDGSSPWSKPLSFTVPYPSPTLKSSGGVIFSRHPMFQWGKDARARSYQLQISGDKEFSTPILDISDLKDPSYALTGGELSYKGQYFWRVKAKDELGESGWSSPLSFNIQMPTPTLSQPMGVIFDSCPTYVWSPPKDAAGARLQVSNREDFAILLVDKPNLQGNTYAMEQDLSYEGVYFWRVKALFPEGESDWSTISRFAIHYQIPEPISPRDKEEVNTLTPVFSWKRTTGAAEYAIQIAKDPGFAKLSAEAKSVKGEIYGSPRLEAGISYFWRAKGIFSNKGESDWSKPLSFTIPQQPLPIIANSLQVTDDKDGNEREPVFTPDGKRILYVVEKKGLKEIWSKEVSVRDGKHQFAKGTSRITWSVSGCQDRHPSPFPDSQHVAYTSNRLRNTDNVWSKPLAGHILTELTCTAEGSCSPAVSPDGKKIAYVAKNIDGNEYVWVMNADGTGNTQFYEGREPAWTPDGQKIVFVSRRAGKSEIWLMDRDGLNLSRLTISTAGEEYMQPSASSDGKRIAFTSNRNGNWDIWIMNLDGSGMRQLTNHLGEDINPTWAPDGKAILYSSTRNAEDLNLWLDYLPSEIVDQGK